MVLKIERFQPEGMNVRMSGGKPSYSHVVTVSGSGKIVYTAGQLARDIDGNCVGKGDMRAQMEQTFQNLDRCLKAAGAATPRMAKLISAKSDVVSRNGSASDRIPGGARIECDRTTTAGMRHDEGKATSFMRDEAGTHRFNRGNRAA